MSILYKQATPEHVKFQRIVMGWLAIASLFFREIDLVWLFFAITLLGLFTGTEYSPVTLACRVLHSLLKRNIVHISSHHVRYYQINVAMDVIDHVLRFIASSAALALYYGGFETASWALMAFLSVFMMLSAYFGFCLSALTFIALVNLRKKFQSKSTTPPASNCNAQIGEKKEHINENCILAKRCFTPYKRCDSCDMNIAQCLGTKFNTLVLLIGMLMSLFLFIENQMFIQVNMLLIMALFFWFGYQVNYNTDALAQSNHAVIALNEKLTRYTESLEAEVKRRTAEIEHLATHDMLTGLFNRFSFEKKLSDALATLDENNPSHVAFIDLDKFKHINDTAGHLAGDNLLINMSSMFLETVADSGIVARLGGDEFAILFKNTSREDALQCCQSICHQAGSYRFEWENHIFAIGTSIGFATLESSMQDIKAVVHHADQACYSAKKSGRNRVCEHALKG